MPANADSPISEIPVAELEELYRAHVDRLVKETVAALEAEQYGALLLHSGTPLARTRFDDQDWPLRVTPAFQHFVPLQTPDCALLVVPGKRPTLYHNVRSSYWEGPSVQESDHFWSAFEVVEVNDPETVKDLLPKGLHIAFVANDAARAGRFGIAPAGVNPDGLIGRLDRIRARKDRYEIECIAEANRRAAKGFSEVFETFRARGCSELELHLRFLQATGQDDAETPFKTIVAMGANAANLHHVRYSRRVAGGASQSLLVDAGATCLGYQSDITRTALKGIGGAGGGAGESGARVFGELVARMERLQQAMCRRVAAGVPYERLHDQAHELLAPILRDLGIARASDDELVGGGVTRKFLPHGLGHSLGVITHDVGCRPTTPRAENPFLRQTAVVEPGLVTTIEPGCYFIGGLLDELRASPAGACVDWALVGELRAFGGVRIEDDLAVLENGTIRNLTRETGLGMQ